jgi:hypothetical protein
LGESIKGGSCKNTEIKILTHQGRWKCGESNFYGGFPRIYEPSRKVRPPNRSESVTYRNAPMDSFSAAILKAQKEPAGEATSGFF